jgi:predicted nucleic acid-binding protein
VIVLDASVVLDVVTAVPAGKELSARIAASGEQFAAPEVIDLEVLQALRRQLRLGKIEAKRAHQALELLNALPLARLSHQLLNSRIWQLRENATAYDAAYLALAELLNASLWTRDAKYLGIPAHRVEIEVL